jgi:hypothetical protein
MMRRANRAVSWLAALIVVISIALILVSRRDPPASVARNVAGAVQPGERLKEYIGSNIAPGEWIKAEENVEPGIPACKTDYENLKSKREALYNPSEDLKFSDPAAYAEQFGYGVVESIRWQGSIPPDQANADGTPGLVLDGASDCLDALIPSLSGMFPPVEVSREAAALLQASGALPEYQQAVSTWRECLFEDGFEANDPLDMTSVVGAQVARVQHPDNSNGEINPALAADDVSTLQAFELRLHSADQACRLSTGLNKVMYDLETGILTKLHEMFPAFNGVNFHSHG